LRNLEQFQIIADKTKKDQRQSVSSMLGKTIGNYRNAGELAQGGMGSVYRGRHQSLPREVVVKSVLFSSFPPSVSEFLCNRNSSRLSFSDA
jgi:serine/threonine protein kinase